MASVDSSMQRGSIRSRRFPRQIPYLYKRQAKTCLERRRYTVKQIPPTYPHVMSEKGHCATWQLREWRNGEPDQQ